jgi:hypothetical protein
MSDSAHIRSSAAALAALPPSDPERLAAEQHAAGCPGCAAALRQAEAFHEKLGEKLGAGDPPPLPAGLAARASGAIVADLKREGRRRALAAVIGAAGALGLALWLLPHYPLHPEVDAIWAATIGGGALILAALSRRWAPAVVIAALVTGVVVAMAEGRTALVAPDAGWQCLLIEVLCAAAAVAAVRLALLGSATALGRRAAAAAAAAGALAGDAALEILCAARVGLPHALLFHLGGLALAAGLAFAVAPWLRAAPRAEAA